MAYQQAITATAAPPKWIVAEDPAPPRMFNGYIHPGPYYEKKADPPIFSPRQEPDPTACDCSACLIYGPKYCKAHVTHISDFYPVPTPAEEAAEIVEAAERRAYREQLIIEQAGKAAKAGHCPKRIEKAAEIARKPAELVLSMAKYFAGPIACRCPDATRRKAPKCKHQLAHIIAANVERRIDAQPQEPTAAAEVAAQPTEVLAPAPPLVTSPDKRMIARRAQERIEAQAQEQSEPAARPSDKFMPFKPEISRDAQGMIWS